MTRTHPFGLALACALSMALLACGDTTDDDGGGNNAENNAQNNSTGNNAQNNNVGNNGTSNNGQNDGLEIEGSYDDNFGGMLVIQGDQWITTYPGEDGVDEYPSTISLFDNQANFAITRNPEDAQFGPNQFNKNVWTEPAADGSFFYCTIVFGQDSEQAALEAPDMADDTDPSISGCGGSPWTMVTPQ